MEENRHRFKSTKWYGQAIGFDMNNAVEVFNLAQAFTKVNAVITIADLSINFAQASTVE